MFRTRQRVDSSNTTNLVTMPSSDQSHREDTKTVSVVTSLKLRCFAYQPIGTSVRLLIDSLWYE